MTMRVRALSLVVCDVRRLAIKPSGRDLVHSRVCRCASYAQQRALHNRSVELLDQDRGIGSRLCSADRRRKPDRRSRRVIPDRDHGACGDVDDKLRLLPTVRTP
jgi:hypothetical protein